VKWGSGGLSGSGFKSRPRKSLQQKLNRYNICGAAILRTRFEPALVAGRIDFGEHPVLDRIRRRGGRPVKEHVWKLIEGARSNAHHHSPSRAVENPRPLGDYFTGG
jgi:hypothetical protein